MSPLEARFRRLLVLYPDWHRSMYEEEMIGVLLSDATPGRRRPGFRDLLDIAVSAVAVRLRRTGADLGGGGWQQAAYAVLVFGSMLLGSISARRVAFAVTVHLRVPAYTPAVEVADVLRLVLWALVVVAALIPLRRTVTVLALAAAVAEAVRIFSWFSFSPPTVLRASWQLTAALMVALAAAWLRPGRRPEWPRSFEAIALAGLVIVASGPIATYAGWSLTDGFPLIPTSSSTALYGGPEVYWLLWLAVVVLMLWAWRRQPAPLRAPMLAFGAPVIAIAVMTPLLFSGYYYSSQQFSSPIPLAPVQWVLLLGVPVLVFVLAVLAARRRERMQHLIRLGREAEQHAVSRPPAAEM
jgi:hypothetical protein